MSLVIIEHFFLLSSPSTAAAEVIDHWESKTHLYITIEMPTGQWSGRPLLSISLNLKLIVLCDKKDIFGVGIHHIITLR